jgi:17beta-estradiol 17-dehydrogenase/3beta-hydroxysteroid 3-dehydrogenase/mitotic-spindle organizing protein 1
MIEENSFKYINVSAEMQLEIVEMQCSTHLKQLFFNSTKLDFYRALQKAEFPKIIAQAQKIIAMFASSYVCNKVFDHEIAEKLN